MQKYMTLFVVDMVDLLDTSTNRLMPGAVFEIDRDFETLEEANLSVKNFNKNGGHVVIVPYYNVESWKTILRILVEIC